MVVMPLLFCALCLVGLTASSVGDAAFWTPYWWVLWQRIGSGWGAGQPDNSSGCCPLPSIGGGRTLLVVSATGLGSPDAGVITWGFGQCRTSASGAAW